MLGAYDSPERTGQLELIEIWILLQIPHDVSGFVPGKYQAKVGDRCRYPVKRNNVLVFELLHQHHFFAKPLRDLSERRVAGNPSEDARSTYTFGFVHGRIVSRYPNNFGGYHFTLVPALPNCGRPGDTL